MAKNPRLRMDNILLVVDDLDAMIAFFAELGMEIEGRATVEGELVPERDDLVPAVAVGGKPALDQAGASRDHLQRLAELSR